MFRTSHIRMNITYCKYYELSIFLRPKVLGTSFDILVRIDTKFLRLTNAHVILVILVCLFFFREKWIGLNSLRACKFVFSLTISLATDLSIYLS